MSILAGRKVLVVGGNGFVGNRIAAKLIQNAAQVTVLSRKGPKYEYPENKQINWIIGDAMEPERVKDKINEADTIIHSVAALIDTSVTKLSKPGEPGTYQQMNRDTFLKILNVLDSPKKIIYISAARPPPFLSRYLTTKQQAEQALLNSKHEGYVIRPGFIYDWKLKKWSIPFRYVIKGWNQMYNPLYGLARNGTFLQSFIEQFQQSEPTSLNKLAESVSLISYQGYDKKIIEDKDLQQISLEYHKLIDFQYGKKQIHHEEAKKDSKQSERNEKI